MVEIAALIRDLPMPGRYRFTATCPIFRASLGAGHSPLRKCQLVGGGASPPWILDVVTIAGGRKAGDTKIDSRLAACRLKWGWRHIVTGEDQHPAAAFSANLKCLHATHNPAMRGDFDLSDALEVHPRSDGMPSSAVSVFGPLHTVEPAAALKPRITRTLRLLYAAEEPIECFVQPTQRGLLAGERPDGHVLTFASNVGELGGLICVANANLVVRPRFPTLLQRGVIQLAMRVQTSRQ